MAAGDFLGKSAAVGDIGDHHARAFGGERLRIVPADALGAASDDRGFSGKSSHTTSPVMAGLVACKSGLPDLRLPYKTIRNSGRPELRVPSTSLWLIMQDVDVRNKCGHDLL